MVSREEGRGKIDRLGQYDTWGLVIEKDKDAGGKRSIVGIGGQLNFGNAKKERSMGECDPTGEWGEGNLGGRKNNWERRCITGTLCQSTRDRGKR